MLKVGLTGGFGSGKSEATRAFARAGAATISLDRIAHELSRKGKPVYRALVRRFGRIALAPTGEIDRKGLAGRVFRRPQMRRRLEAATHPIILREMRKRIRRNGRPVVVVDAPLLFEAGLQGEFDLSLVVTAPRSARLRRVMRRDGGSRASALRRMRAQIPLSRKERLGDVVIRNDGNLRGLRRRVAEYHRAFDLIARSTTTGRKRRK